MLRIPFLYTAALYYGHLVHQGRLDQARAGLIERERLELKTLHEITSVTTSTLDIKEVLYLIAQRIALMVDARRCSILTVDEKDGRCMVLASSDDPHISGLLLDMDKYPEVRRAIETRETVVQPGDPADVVLADEVRARGLAADELAADEFEYRVGGLLVGLQLVC